jgi:hypothetical protein
MSESVYNKQKWLVNLSIINYITLDYITFIKYITLSVKQLVMAINGLTLLGIS